jgi:hypothetical protein
VTAEASAVVASTAKVAVVPAMISTVMVTSVVVASAVMVTATAAMVSEVTRPGDPVHGKGQTGNLPMVLPAEPAFAKDAPHDENETGDEPQDDGLSDLCEVSKRSLAQTRRVAIRFTNRRVAADAPNTPRKNHTTQ